VPVNENDPIVPEVSGEDPALWPGLDQADELDPRTMIGALNEMTKSSNRAAQVNLDLVLAVRRESELRDRKIHSIEETNRSIQKAIWGGVVALVLLLILAVVNVYNTTTTNKIARNAQQTNELLVGCFTPGSSCQKQTLANQEAQQGLIRQQAFVIAVCQRQNPADSGNPTGSTVKLLDCIHKYYPDLQLPPEKQ
jgi:uncharacterized integral membrane protein